MYEIIFAIIILIFFYYQFTKTKIIEIKPNIETIKNNVWNYGGKQWKIVKHNKI